MLRCLNISIQPRSFRILVRNLRLGCRTSCLHTDYCFCIPSYNSYSRFSSRCSMDLEDTPAEIQMANLAFPTRPGRWSSGVVPKSDNSWVRQASIRGHSGGVRYNICTCRPSVTVFIVPQRLSNWDHRRYRVLDVQLQVLLSRQNEMTIWWDSATSPPRHWMSIANWVLLRCLVPNRHLPPSRRTLGWWLPYMVHLRPGKMGGWMDISHMLRNFPERIWLQKVRVYYMRWIGSFPCVKQ